MLGRIGAAFLLGGAALFVIDVAIALGGGTLGLAEHNSPPPTVGELFTLAAVAVVGIGTLAISIAGAGAAVGPTRAGLGLVGIGFVGLAIGSLLPSVLGVYEESYPLLIQLAALAASAIGLLATGVSLLRSPGELRLAGLALLGGLVALVLGLTQVAPALAAVLFLLVPFAFARVAVTVLRADQPRR